MFGSKKRKLKKEQQARDASESRARIEKAYDVRIQATARIKDPAEKILALRQIQLDIWNQMVSTNNAAIKQAKKEGGKVGTAASAVQALGSTGALAYICVVGVVAAAPVSMIVAPAALATGFIGKAISSRRTRKLKDKLTLENADHVLNLGDQADLVETMMNVAVENNVEAISKSPLRPKVLEIPDLSEKFAVASAQHIAAAKKAAEAAPPAEEKKPAAPRKKQPPKYDELNGL